MPNTLPESYRSAFPEELKLHPATSDGRFVTGQKGVLRIAKTGDSKVEYVDFGTHVLAHVTSALGYPAYYPAWDAGIERPVKAILMDLDGTSVHSEAFWIWIIEKSVASVLGDPAFSLEEADLPYVSGHSVSEHLQYCLDKYCPDGSLESARAFYFQHTRRELAEIMRGAGRANAFVPAPGLREFLVEIKSRNIKAGLVTSGLHEKAWPEIVAAFREMEMGDPADFYDCIVTAGYPLGQGSPGTLGELSPKPHPWLYAETARVGLGIPFDARRRVVGLEDSGAGVCAIRLAGFAALGMQGGNIAASGVQTLCSALCTNFQEVLNALL